MTATGSEAAGRSRYVTLTADEWGRLRDTTPLVLDENDLRRLRGLGEPVSLEEVAQVYLPLSRLLNLYVAATQRLHAVSDEFLGTTAAKVPYIVGIGGSVAVGKSTTARILRALLARWPDHPRVDLVTTDGFLLPNAELERRGLMNRKGFPESYDRRRLVDFLAAVKAGTAEVHAPVYSHRDYDVLPGQTRTVRQPDIVIVEGLNVLQTGGADGPPPRLFVSDFFDFSIYVDADEADIRRWYVERFLALRQAVFADPGAYFHRYAALSDAQARTTAAAIWDDINGPNLRANILPTRERAHLILGKDAEHSVRQVRLRKL